MSNSKHQQLLLSIKHTLDHLQSQISNVQEQTLDEAYFDSQLFAPLPQHKQHTHKLQDYLQECYRNYGYLQQEVTANNPQQVSYLTEKLTNQILALSRELATHHQRAKQPKTVVPTQPETIYHTHARYLSYHRRLSAMHSEVKQQFTQAKDYRQKQRLQKQLQELAQRLIRCTKAIEQLEQHL